MASYISSVSPPPFFNCRTNNPHHRTNTAVWEDRCMSLLVLFFLCQEQIRGLGPNERSHTDELYYRCTVWRKTKPKIRPTPSRSQQYRRLAKKENKNLLYGDTANACCVVLSWRVLATSSNQQPATSSSEQKRRAAQRWYTHLNIPVSSGKAAKPQQLPL